MQKHKEMLSLESKKTKLESKIFPLKLKKSNTLGFTEKQLDQLKSLQNTFDFTKYIKTKFISQYFTNNKYETSIKDCMESIKYYENAIHLKQTSTINIEYQYYTIAKKYQKIAFNTDLHLVKENKDVSSSMMNCMRISMLAYRKALNHMNLQDPKRHSLYREYIKCIKNYYVMSDTISSDRELISSIQNYINNNSWNYRTLQYLGSNYICFNDFMELSKVYGKLLQILQICNNTNQNCDDLIKNIANKINNLYDEAEFNTTWTGIYFGKDVLQCLNNTDLPVSHFDDDNRAINGMSSMFDILFGEIYKDLNLKTQINSDIYFMVGYALHLNKKYDKAIQCYRVAVENINNEKPTIKDLKMIYMLGTALFHDQQYAEAITYYKNAINLSKKVNVNNDEYSYNLYNNMVKQFDKMHEKAKSENKVEPLLQNNNEQQQIQQEVQQKVQQQNIGLNEFQNFDEFMNNNQVKQNQSQSKLQNSFLENNKQQNSLLEENKLRIQQDKQGLHNKQQSANLGDKTSKKQKKF